MTTLADPGPAPQTSRSGRFWALVPVGLLGLMFVGWAVMITIAVNDPGFALEPDYYKKALGWDGQQAQQADNARLGWHVDLEQVRDDASGARTFELRVRDAAGMPIRGARVSVEAFFNARAAQRLTTSFSEVDPGTYRARLPIRHPGLWEFRLTIAESAATFTAVIRRDVSTEER